MKKTVNRIIILTMSIFLLFGAIPISASAASKLGDYLVAIDEDNTIRLLEYQGNSTNVTVPNEIEGHKVSYLSRGSFTNEQYVSKIEKIFIESEVHIGEPGYESDVAVMFFSCSNLTEIQVDEDNTNYTSKDGILYSKDEKTLFAYPVNKAGDSFTVPSSVDYVYTYALAYNKNLKKIDFAGNTVQFSEAVLRNTQIEEVTLPESINLVGFADCPKLQKAYIGKNVPERHFDITNCPNVTLYVYKGSSAEKYAKENSIPYEYRTDTIVDEATGVTVTGVFDMNSILTVKSKTLEGTPKPVTQVLELSMTPSPEGELEISIPGLENQYIFEYTDGEYKIIPTTYSNNAYAFKTSNLGTYYISSSPNIIIPYSLGDVNGDGEITIDDATNIQVHLARIKELSTEGLSAADFNGDGKVNILDTTYIRLYLAKIIVK